MEISKNLIFFKKREYFDRDFETISPTKICFIEDTKEVYTKGVFFDGSTFDPSDLEASILNIINTKADKSELPTKTSDLTNDSKYLNWQTVEQEIETARSIIGNCNLIEVDSQPLDLPINNEILLDTNNNILYIGIKNKIWWVIDNLKLFNPLIPDAKIIGTTLDVLGKVIDNILYTDSLNVQYNII